ncbi:MAG: hypothetical protein GF388_09480, partial [Candidatus Aegiribacteria sp.]|nr:hypothetical protein [Candidatus Aegiribacteria sp.]
MKTIKLICLAYFLLPAAASAAAVPSYRIYCDPAEYEVMIENYEEDIEIDCIVILDDTVYSNAKIRLRGDSSRGYPKKSYRITFDENMPFNGRTEWNFNSEYIDETYMHSWLFAWIMHELDYPCFTVDHARLYVNDLYIGLYVKLEPIDEQFLSDRGMDPDASLYKAAEDGACLSIFDDVSSSWEKKANEGENWNDLYDLIESLEKANPVNFHETAGEIFQINDLMTILAVNTLTMNFSTYYHNYFMYRDIRGTGLWTMMPWDVDRLWTDWFSRSYAHSSCAYWWDNPLLEKVILNPVLLQAYFDRMDTVAQTVLAPEKINPVIDSLEIVLTDAVAEDEMDAITLSDFQNAVSELRDNRIQGRVGALQWMYEEDPRPFRAFRGDTLSLGSKFVSWQTCEDPQGSSIEYGLCLYKREDWPDDTLEFHQLTDTCFTFYSLTPGSYVWSVDGSEPGGRSIEAYDHFNPFTVTDSWTPLSGDLSGINVLTSDESPYYVEDDIVIPGSASLQIQSGVDIRIAEEVTIQCFGDISCLGTSTDSVRFLADNVSEPWNGLSLNGAEADFTCTSFSGAGISTGSSDSACIEAENSDLSFDRCSFSGSVTSIDAENCNFSMDSCRVRGSSCSRLLMLTECESVSISRTDLGCTSDSSTVQNCGIELRNCVNSGNTIENCLISNIDGDGILCTGSFLAIDKTCVWNVKGNGILAGMNPQTNETSNVTLTSNVIWNCGVGVLSTDGTSSNISSCTICLCGTALESNQETSGANAGQVTVENSIFHSNRDLFSFQGESQVSYSLTGDDEVWPGDGNIATNPMFAEWDNFDFHLSYESPCIDAGNPEATDPDGTRSDMGAYFFPQNFEKVVINEIQSVNDTTIADCYGEFDDWFELYNGSDYDCDLSWVFVSDDPAELEKYQFPPGSVITAGGYLLIWADGHTWQNGYHLPFELSGTGDSIYISRQIPGNSSAFCSTKDRNTLLLFDQKEFSSISPDVSLGRISDGSSEWSIMETCTPGWSNSLPWSDH